MNPICVVYGGNVPKTMDEKIQVIHVNADPNHPGNYECILPVIGKLSLTVRVGEHQREARKTYRPASHDFENVRLPGASHYRIRGCKETWVDDVMGLKPDKFSTPNISNDYLSLSKELRNWRGTRFV